MRYGLGGVRLVLLFLFTLGCYLGYLVSIPFLGHSDARGFRLRRFYLQWAMPLLGFCVSKRGEIPSETALFICNHKGLLDFFVALRYVNAYILSKAEMSKFPVLGPASRYTGVIFVDRGNKKSRGAAREAIVTALKSGKSVMVFPEGTTHNGKTTKEFHKGSFEEAAAHGFPVVPVALEYRSARDYYKDRSVLKVFMNGFGKAFTHARIHYGPAIRHKDPAQLLEETQNWIDGQLIRMQDDWSRVQW